MSQSQLNCHYLLSPSKVNEKESFKGTPVALHLYGNSLKALTWRTRNDRTRRGLALPPCRFPVRLKLVFSASGAEINHIPI